MVNVHYNWVEKIKLEAKSAMALFFFKSPETASMLSWLKNWKLRTAVELEMQLCCPREVMLLRLRAVSEDLLCSPPHTYECVCVAMAAAGKIQGRISVVDVAKPHHSPVVVLGKVVKSKSVFSPMRG